MGFIEDIGVNLFLLDLVLDIDRLRAMLDGPWSFFKDLVVFKAPVGLQRTVDMVFDEMTIWVQLHNVPLAFMIVPIIQSIGGKLGKVLEVEIGEDGRWKM